MKYKKITVTHRGGLEAIKITESELRQPETGEARIRVLATPVCQDDIAIRTGNRPFLRKPPYIPGYSFIGVVDAAGEDADDVSAGDRVAALTQFNSHAEYIYWKARDLVQVPHDLDPAEAAPLILNYLVAYQILHRVACVKAGDKVLLIGASGGVGTAFLQLGQLAELKMYGLASAEKHPALREYGAIPIDYSARDFSEVIRQAEPEGLDFVFNGMGPEYFKPGLSLLHRRGILVHYGGPQSLGDFLILIVKLIANNLLPNGKRIKGYGTHREGLDTFKEDWTILFNLLKDGKIRPIIAERLPLLKAAEAYEMLEKGNVTGNIVLLAPKLPASSSSSDPHLNLPLFNTNSILRHNSSVSGNV
jgi:NADPH:quinone reductase-like Zn-dependent oxidoreductase